MNWWGKMVGGTFGFLAGGPLGAALGAALGHSVDHGLSMLRREPSDTERVQTAFFTATFTVMGHVAKVDGRVSELEIAFAESVIARMALGTEQRRTAIALFREGKAPGFPLQATLAQFRRVCGRRRDLLRMFLEVQLQAAYADGELAPPERQLLLRICELLGLSRGEFERLDALTRAGRRFGGRQGHGAPVRTPAELLRDAYGILGVSPQADAAAVKRAYRRLMNQHHPDKLVAKGLPEEMVKVATAKTQEIKRAYETIKEARGIG